MLALLIAATAASSDLSVRVVDRPDLGPNRYYVGNRAPLTASAFRKLPIGAIKPEGWVRKQLRLQADGFVGHLTEISSFLDKHDNAWLSPNGEGKNGWEEVPYWLKGFGDLGYVLDDARIQKEAKVWIDGVIAGQREDGYFGPRANLKSNDGKPDVWPNMVMLNALQSYHERTGDPRVINLMRRYFRWQLNQPDQAFLLSYWEKHRGGDNMASVFWLYNRTGDGWLLELAHKLHRRTADWTGGMPDGHGVNFAQAFREPATYAALTHNPVHLTATERDYEIMRDAYGQVPGGMYGADENVRPGMVDPRQAAETCAMVEMMLSDELLLAQTGDPVWAERCEDVTFNSLPASMTPDLKALHYLTSPNMPLIDKRSKSPGLQNGGPMLLFDPHDHRCCQHNVSHGWPYYAEHLWLATAGDGLGAALYAPSKVTAKVGDGTPVTIEENTNYPFESTIRFTVRSPKRVRFPLTLRLPSWCDAPTLSLNGQAVKLPHLGAYAILEREWKDGDRLELMLPMHLSVRKWTGNKDSISVDRGPLTYSLKIGEKYERQGGTDAWPAFEVHPTTPWNYGLVDGEEMKVVRRPFPSDGQPFTPGSSPIEIRAKARRIPQWKLDQRGLIDQLQASPARTSQPVETVTLIPMGAARLRISAFPTVTTGKAGHVWEAPLVPRPAYPASSSHTFSADTTDALSDGIVPRAGSGDESIPRFTWWDHKGGVEWVEYDFPSPRKLAETGVYWFDDRPGGGCRVPESWRLLAWVNGEWREVQSEGAYGVERDRFNSVRFAPVTTSKLRLEAKLQPDASAGILEWRVR